MMWFFKIIIVRFICVIFVFFIKRYFLFADLTEGVLSTIRPSFKKKFNFAMLAHISGRCEMCGVCPFDFACMKW